MRSRNLPLLFLLLLCAATAHGSLRDHVITKRITDLSGVLSPAYIEAKAAELKKLEEEKTRQINVLLVPDVRPEYSGLIEAGTDLFSRSGLGTKKGDNGLLLIITTQTHKARIVTGYGLEGVMTDADSSRIVREDIHPPLDANNFQGAVDAGIRAILAQLGSAPADEPGAPDAPTPLPLASTGAQAQPGSSGAGFGIIVVLAVLFGGVLLIMFLLFGSMRRKRRDGSTYGSSGGDDAGPTITTEPETDNGWGGPKPYRGSTTYPYRGDSSRRSPRRNDVRASSTSRTTSHRSSGDYGSRRSSSDDTPYTGYTAPVDYGTRSAHHTPHYSAPDPPSSNDFDGGGGDTGGGGGGDD